MNLVMWGAPLDVLGSSRGVPVSWWRVDRRAYGFNGLRFKKWSRVPDLHAGTPHHVSFDAPTT